MFKQILHALTACCMVLPLSGSAQPKAAAEDEGESNRRLELEVGLPPSSKAANLLQFEPSAASTNRFYIDAESIFIGADGIVRYTLVVKSPSGAETISREGMRCDTKERKNYAFGRSDGTWASARVSEWQPIIYQEFNRQHGVLYADYFCPDGSPIRSAADAIRRFKYGVPYGAPPRSGSVR
jgi:hypothetical protein